MPQNTPMKMQWITVDGRQTPIVLPQIWNHEKQDWEVTSDQNRLPVDAQLTGSNVVDGILVKQTNGVIPIQEKLGTIPGNGSKFVRVKFLEETGLINNISLVGRNSTNKPIEIDIREGYLQSSDNWNTSQSFKDIVFPESSNTAILTERQPTLSQAIYIYVTNKSDTDIELLSLGVMLWG